MEQQGKLYYIVSAKNGHDRARVSEFENEAEALKEFLDCWILYYFRDITIECKWKPQI